MSNKPTSKATSPNSYVPVDDALIKFTTRRSFESIGYEAYSGYSSENKESTHKKISPANKQKK